MYDAFIDWLTISQLHPSGGLPVITDGFTVVYNARGVPVVERNLSTSLEGSFSSKVRIGCDGCRISLSGNIGRFSRKDNLFNYDWDETLARCNRILFNFGFPPFTPSIGIKGQDGYQRGAVVSRIDLTHNFATQSPQEARSVINHLATRSIARAKRGHSPNESVWWANTRFMLKAYLKGAEMKKHITDIDDLTQAYLDENNIVRVELELKKRELSDLGLNDIAQISQEKLNQIFYDETHDLLNSLNCQHHQNLLDLPIKLRCIASAWLSGEDIHQLMSESTYYRRCADFRRYGWDISSPLPRNSDGKIIDLKQPTKLITLTPLSAPDWYTERDKEINNLRLVA